MITISIIDINRYLPINCILIYVAMTFLMMHIINLLGIEKSRYQVFCCCCFFCLFFFFFFFFLGGGGFGVFLFVFLFCFVLFFWWEGVL